MEENKSLESTANFCYENELAFISRDEEEQEEDRGERGTELETLSANLKLRSEVISQRIWNMTLDCHLKDFALS